MLVLGQDAPLEQLAPKIALAARHPICRGFAVGRTIFGDAAKAWFAGRIDEAAVIEQVASRYGALIELLFDSDADARRACGRRAAGALSSRPEPEAYDTYLEERAWNASDSSVSGLMGHGIAKNLLAKGYPLTFKAHRNRAQLADLLAAGAREVPTFAEVDQRERHRDSCV